jgi:hypothetical protein
MRVQRRGGGGGEIKRYRTHYPILSDCLPLLKMFLRPSRPEWRLKEQHLLYDVQGLPFSRPGSRVSTREGSHSVIHSRRAGGPMDLCPWKVCSTWKSEDKSPPCTVPAHGHQRCINLQKKIENLH